MGFNNPAMPWRELEQTLSGVKQRSANGRAAGSPSWNAGGDGPAWSRKRQPFEPAVARLSAGPVSQRPVTPYAELHCKSNFSFLNGASHPEQLAEEAARLGLEALALTDQNGLYGVVRFAEAAKAVGLATVFGAEVTLDITRYEPGLPDPPGEHVVLLADGPAGYARLARALSLGQLEGEKGAPRFSLDRLSEVAAAGGTANQQQAWWVLTGCRSGLVPAALVRDGPAAAARALQRLIALFGRERVAVELWDHGDPLDTARNDALAEIAGRNDVCCIATNDVHYATPQQRRLATALSAVRARRSLQEMDPWLPAGATAHLRSGAEQKRRFERYPGVVEVAADMGRAAAFDLALVAPNLPPFDCPNDARGVPLTEMQYLRELVEVGGIRRYGERPHAGEDLSIRARAWHTIDHELDVIDGLGFPGYFLVVWDIVRFCERSDILCQGRGSAANSAVCFALGITKADAVSLGLLFERFLSPERDGPPDIDIDIESDRREE
ncbi:MAG: PHP domain-containing protein, partial [Ilumatobacteraceae bacterium]